jgi:hypothetical protein
MKRNIQSTPRPGGVSPRTAQAPIQRSPGLKKLLLAVSLAAVVSSVQAHHSAAMFDMSKTFTVQGTVKEFQYTNPHSWLQVLVVSPDGKIVEWGFETEGPSTLLRVGIKLKTFQPGDKVTIVAHPMRDGRPAGSWVSATKADGTVYNLRPAPKVAAK